jgi:hypothetical protein
MVDAESVDVLADAKRLARKTFWDDKATVDRLDSPDIELFLKKLNEILEAAAANCSPDVTPAIFLRAVERIARENGIPPSGATVPTSDQVSRAVALAMAMVSAASRRDWRLMLVGR